VKPIQSLRGIQDVIGEDARLWDRVEAQARQVFDRFGFEPIRIPLLEETALFQQSVGESTDIVQKEMYHFVDRSKLDIALRPEGTAGVVRAYIQRHLGKERPVHRLYYMGPMFRAERPQAGRLRQFYQIGAEIFGTPSVYADVEMLELLVRLMEAWGVKGYRLQMNNLGNARDREAYTQVLKKHFGTQTSKLCRDCQKRLEGNVLRLLDCKVPSCQPYLDAAPPLSASVSKESQKDFETVMKLLEGLKIKPEINPRIVRGLDYYTNTVFELTHPALGAPNVLAAGGRYDALVEKLGGSATPAVGFALGVERLVMSLEKVSKKHASHAAVIAMGHEAQAVSFSILSELRKNKISAVMDFDGRSLKAQMRQANKCGAQVALIIGEDEMKKGTVTLKELSVSDGKQTEISQKDVVKVLKEKRGEVSHA